MIGLMGSHRTGKTTLAKEFAAIAEIQFVETSTSKVFRENGFDPQANYDMATRIRIQNLILDDAEAKYMAAEAAGKDFITDRTPLDMLAYLLADVQRQGTSEEEDSMIARYKRRAFQVTNRYFTALFLVQPGIPLVADPTKAPILWSYMDHLNSLMMGLMCDEQTQASKNYIPRNMLDLHERVRAINNAMRKTVERHESLVVNSGATFH